MHDDSVSEWLDLLKEGDSFAAKRLWQRYVDRLVHLARKHLGAAPRRAADEEDVVVTAFDSFCRRVRHGGFPKMDDRDDLWQVLVMIIERKAISQMRHEGATKRGSGKVRGDSAMVEPRQGHEAPRSMDRFANKEPLPEYAIQLTELLQQLREKKGDRTFRVIVAKMEGYTNPEIACRLKTSLSSVERTLRLVRRTWESETES